MKKLFIKLYYWLPPLLMATLIFVASSQPYEQQDLRPTLLENFDLTIVEKYASGVSFIYAGTEISIKSRGAAGFVEFLIRKSAHFFVYFILAFTVYRLLNYLYMIKFKSPLTLILVILYAISDEIHQYFIPNRTGLVEDVILDSIGGFFGLIVAKVIFNRNVRREP